jgi:hypothetical protein
MSVSVKGAQNKRHTELVRELADFLFQHLGDVVRERLGRSRRTLGKRVRLHSIAAAHGCPQTQCNPHRDTVKPGRQSLTTPDGTGLSRESEEDRLERIISILGAAEQAPAGAEDQRPVPPHKQLECGFVTGLGEPA